MGTFIISLDFELLWGMRDHADRNSYGTNVLGAREAVPRMLDLFAKHDIKATWATVGFLFCENKDELLHCVPVQRPVYKNTALSNYSYFNEVGRNERDDPYYYAPSLIRTIADVPGQEIATHTLSHYYCLEDGATVETFEADLIAARTLAAARGIELKSIVFPRNQYGPEHLAICKREGLTTYPGNPSGWAYRAGKGTEQTKLRRALRLLDAHTGALGAHAFEPDRGTPQDVPASRFLRPCAGRLAPFHPLHVATIKRGMTRAAKSGTGYHLWWHPHNFGRDLEANMKGLSEIVAHFASLHEGHGMLSRAMENYE